MRRFTLECVGRSFGQIANYAAVLPRTPPCAALWSQAGHKLLVTATVLQTERVIYIPRFASRRLHMRDWTGLSQHTLEAILKGKPVRRATLQPVRAGVIGDGRERNAGEKTIV
jgi:hypothetical protein